MKQPFALVCFVLALCGAGPGWAQQTQTQGGLSLGTVATPVLTIDSDRLFFESDFGAKATAQAEQQRAELGAQNRQIEADLAAEEQDLTVRRAGMEPLEFRKLAEAFDKKVQETRAAQAGKGRAITEDFERQREVFLNAALPVLNSLMEDAGALVILDRRTVVVSASAIEITNDAIALLNETLGSDPD